MALGQWQQLAVSRAAPSAEVSAQLAVSRAAPSAEARELLFSCSQIVRVRARCHVLLVAPVPEAVGRVADQGLRGNPLEEGGKELHVLVDIDRERPRVSEPVAHTAERTHDRAHARATARGEAR